MRSKKTKVQEQKPEFDYQSGFWIDKHTFIKADDAEIKIVGRPTLSGTHIEEAKMVVFSNAIEMTVDGNNKILGIEKHPKFGLWLDTVEKAIQDRHDRSIEEE
jgi:hypothetical protein